MSENPRRTKPIEIFNVIISIVNLIILLGVGYVGNQTSKNLAAINFYQTESNLLLSDTLRNNARMYDMRYNKYEEVAYGLNKIYSYIYYTGNWKSMNPEEIMRIKFASDEIVNSHSVLFDSCFLDSYEEFMNLSFKRIIGPKGEDFLIFADYAPRQHYYKGSLPWQQDWAPLFYNWEIYKSITGTNNRIDFYNEIPTESRFDNEVKDRERREQLKDIYYQLLLCLKVESHLYVYEVSTVFEDLKPSKLL